MVIAKPLHVFLLSSKTEDNLDNKRKYKMKESGHNSIYYQQPQHAVLDDGDFSDLSLQRDDAATL